MKEIDDLAYRLWSIHPRELDKMEDLIKRCPPDYKGGIRAFYYATEVAKLLEAHAYQNAKEAVIGWTVCHSVHRDYAIKSDPFYKTRTVDYKRAEDNARNTLTELSESLKKYIDI